MSDDFPPEYLDSYTESFCRHAVSAPSQYDRTCRALAKLLLQAWAYGKHWEDQAGVYAGEKCDAEDARDAAIRAKEAALDGIRPEVFAFARAMERKLKENDHKGGWQDCSVMWLLRRLREETDELHRAIGESNDASQILAEAADVANFAMMIADVCGGLEEK